MAKKKVEDDAEKESIEDIEVDEEEMADLDKDLLKEDVHEIEDDKSEVDDAVDLVDLEKEDKELEKELKIPAPKARSNEKDNDYCANQG